MDVVKTKNLTKVYVQGGHKVFAVRNANLTIKEGEFVSIVGPSGSGKTTLLQLIGLLLQPTSGQIWLDGVEVTKLSEPQRAMIRRRKIGFVFQQFNLIPTLTVSENVALPMVLDERHPKEIEFRVRRLLRDLGLASRAHFFPSQLSGGQMQRVAIARALANHPSLILADEPTGNLDSKSGEQVLRLFKALHDEGQTIVLITHDKNIAQKAERFFYIKDGQIEEVDNLEGVI